MNYIAIASVKQKKTRLGLFGIKTASCLADAREQLENHLDNDDFYCSIDWADEVSKQKNYRQAETFKII